MRAWDHTAWLCFHIPRFTKRRFSVEDFHPLRAQHRSLNVTQFDQWRESVKDKLPDDLSEAEIMRRYEAVKEELNARSRK